MCVFQSFKNGMGNRVFLILLPNTYIISIFRNYAAKGQKFPMLSNCALGQKEGKNPPKKPKN